MKHPSRYSRADGAALFVSYKGIGFALKSEPRSFTQQTKLLIEFDVTPRDPAHWADVKDQVRATVREFYGKDHVLVWRSIYKRIREKHFESLVKDFEDVMPGEISRWAWDQIRAQSDGLDCVDSQRCGKRGNTSSMRRFRRGRSCCGSQEWEEVCPIDGKRYRLGFNFGH